MLIDFGTRQNLHISTPKPFGSLHNLGSKCSTKSLSFFKTKSVVSLILLPVTVPPERAVAVRSIVGWKRTVSSASPPTLLRIDKSDATENGKDGFPVENLVEKIAAIRERRQRHVDMLARNSIGPERARSRSPTPTAERWRIRALR
jgi:hypothetical protein